MSNEAPAAPAAAPTPAPAAAPAAPATPPAAPASPQTPPERAEPTQPATPEFKVPDAWKDKPWASKVKSQEDLYKQIDGLDQLKGKKTLAIDYANSTPEEIAAHYSSLAPKDAAEYGFDKIEGVDAERMGKVAPILQKAGLTVHQAQEVAKNYAAFEKSSLEAATSEEGFRDQMSKSFGEKYDAAVASVVETHKKHLSPEDQQMVEAMPNEWLALTYRMTQKMTDAHKTEVAELTKKYGAQENGDAHLNKGGQPVVVDVDKQRSELRAKIRELDTRSHTEAERQKLINDLQATYSQQQGKK